MMPNLDQAWSALRTILAAVVGWAAGRHLIGDDTAALLLTIAPIAVPLVWGMLAHTDAAKISAVEALPDVKSIIVAPSAPLESAAIDAATDPARPKVKTA